jgi:hypothetical protein
MRRVMGVIGLGLLLSACGTYGYGYHHRGYYGGGYYASPSYTYAQQQPQQQQVGVVVQQPGQAQVVVQPGQPQQQQVTVSVAGEGIGGSDGSRGWRVSSQAPSQDFQRMMAAATRANCQVEASSQSELRAICNGTVHVMLRFDQANVYKLCAPGTDASVCTQVWSSVGN